MVMHVSSATEASASLGDLATHNIIYRLYYMIKNAEVSMGIRCCRSRSDAQILKHCGKLGKYSDYNDR